MSANGDLVVVGGPGEASDGIGEGAGVHQGELRCLFKTAYDTILRRRKGVLLKDSHTELDQHDALIGQFSIEPIPPVLLLDQQCCMIVLYSVY